MSLFEAACLFGMGGLTLLLFLAFLLVKEGIEIEKDLWDEFD